MSNYADTLPIRQRAVALARQQVGCHYVWGGAGNTPDQADGAYYRTSAVHMHFDDPSPGRPGNEPGRRQPILYAAWCRVDGDKVCAGRSSLPAVQALPDGTRLNACPINPQAYRWPRPSGEINGHTLVYGECCLGIRHFDCIGLINWVVSTVAKPTHHGIGSIINNTTAVAFSDVQPGDLLTINQTHIGIATGLGTVVQAQGTATGVVETHLPPNGGGWTRCGRPAVSFWR
jgi:cell wall-associated NlpC family hydrolase